MTKTSPALDERIKAIRAEIDAIIDAHVEQIAKDTPGIPLEVIRRTVVPGGCPCSDFLDLREKGTL